MKKLVLLGLVAGAAFLTPVMTPAPAEAQSVTVRVGEPGYRPVTRVKRTTVVRSGPVCRTTTVRTKRPNGSVMIRKVRRCN